MGSDGLRDCAVHYSIHAWFACAHFAEKWLKAHLSAAKRELSTSISRVDSPVGANGVQPSLSWVAVCGKSGMFSRLSCRVHGYRIWKLYSTMLGRSPRTLSRQEDSKYIVADHFADRTKRLSTNSHRAKRDRYNTFMNTLAQEFKEQTASRVFMMKGLTRKPPSSRSPIFSHIPPESLLRHRGLA